MNTVFVLSLIQITVVGLTAVYVTHKAGPAVGAGVVALLGACALAGVLVGRSLS